MNILRSQPLKQKAAESLRQTDCRKTVLLHTALSIGVTLMLAVLDLMLSAAMGSTGGLAGRGLRAILETVRSLLSMVLSLALPFWQIGILYTSIRVTRQQSSGFSLLTRGFHRFGPVLRYYLILLAILLGISLGSSYLAVPIAMMIGIPPELETAMLSLDESILENPELLMESIPMDQMMSFFLSLMIPMLVICFAATLYFSYRFRLCPYLLLDDPQIGALQALSISGQMTKGNKWNLCKLDLSFWWYYLLQALISALTAAPTLLALSGVTLPIDSTVSFLLFQIIGAAASLALTWWKGADLELTYAWAYETLRTPPQEITVL